MQMSIMAFTVGYRGAIRWNPTKPDGMAHKLLDVSRLYAMNWHHKHSLHGGMITVHDYFLPLSSRLLEGGGQGRGSTVPTYPIHRASSSHAPTCRC